METKEEKESYIDEALTKAGVSSEKFMQYLEASRRIIALKL
jgi:hypothetical protein